ncbi:MAG TPA: hypothetical protein VFF78_03480, partial [Anaerolineaceae bacterium]|nr:hypothetical protein [Anaerolineaceae bacterium]
SQHESPVIPVVSVRQPVSAPVPLRPAQKSERVVPEPVLSARVDSPPAHRLEPVQGSGEEISLQSITQQWAKIRAQVKRQRSQTEGLLNSCKPLAVRDGALVLGFASDLLKTKMEQGENIQLIREVIQQLVGVDLPVLCTVIGAKANQNPGDAGVDSDGMVGTALNLGGTIVHKE